HGADHLLLALGPPDVAEWVGVPHPGEGQGGLAVGHVAAGLPCQLRVGVVDVVVQAQPHTVHGVDDIGDTAHPDLHVVVHRDAGERFHGLYQQLRAAIGVGAVEFVRAVAGDLHVGVAGQGDQ